jgi:site-specific DNA-methyltransferase (adenine-specific)
LRHNGENLEPLHKAGCTLNKEGIEVNIWKYSTGLGNTTKDKIAFNHPAVFPEQLARDHIKSWSKENDIILDPMCGSGTTCKIAIELNRKFIGIEISPEYCKISEERIKIIENDLRLNFTK